MLKKAFDKFSMSTPGIHKWYNRFKEGREDVDDDKRKGRPNTSISDENVAKIIVLSNRRITVRKVAKELIFHMAHVNQFLRTFDI